MVLVDGDGLGTSAEEATVKSSEEMMSNPETLKSFINFCARYAPQRNMTSFFGITAAALLSALAWMSTRNSSKSGTSVR